MDDGDTTSPDGPAGSQRVRVAQVVAGAIVGFAATWALFMVALVTVYARYGDSTGPVQNVIAFGGLLLLPVLFGVLLVPRRTRQWGAGAVTGLAAGAIAGAGICGGFLGISSM